MPIHLIWGDDSAARENAIEALINETVDYQWSSINLTRRDGSDSSQASLALEEARTPPFGSGGRLTVLNRSPFCNGCNSQLAEQFQLSVDLIPKDSHLVLNNSLKPDGRLKTTKTIQKLVKAKIAQEKVFSLPTLWDVEGQRKLVQRTAEELNLHLEGEAIETIVDLIGNDSIRLRNELEKLSINLSIKTDKSDIPTAPPKITVAKINSLIAGETTNVFRVGDALLEGNTGEAITQLDLLINAGDPALRIIATLSGQIRGWLWVSMLEKQGEKDVAVIAKAAGIANPKRIYILRKQINGKKPTVFLKMLSQVLEIEADLKNGKQPNEAFRDGLIKTS